MTEPIECSWCYCEFDKRTDAPALLVCPDCLSDPKDVPDYACPTCGWNSTLDDMGETIIASTPQRWSYGSEGYNWEETHKCPGCGTEWTYSNGT